MLLSSWKCIGEGHEKRRTTKSKVSITWHKCNTFLCKDDLSYTSTYSKYHKEDKQRKYSFKFWLKIEILQLQCEKLNS